MDLLDVCVKIMCGVLILTVTPVLVLMCLYISKDIIKDLKDGR